MTETERDRIKALEIQMQHTSVKLDKMEAQLGLLVTDMHERRGREAAERLGHVEEREDKWQTWAWVRAFIPLGLLVGLLNAIWLAAYRAFTGATP